MALRVVCTNGRAERIVAQRAGHEGGGLGDRACPIATRADEPGRARPRAGGAERAAADDAARDAGRTGGVGKTRLALRFAARMAARPCDRYADGVCLVELANVSDERMLPSAVAQALGIAETGGMSVLERVLESMRDWRLLLVVDNCEHLLDGCAKLAHAIVRACPRVTLLVTSREPLRIAGETTWPVPPLSLAADGDRAGAASDAVQLFVERARGVDPHFELTAQNQDVVMDICARMEGVPLAIELAAARIRSLPPRSLARTLDVRRRWPARSNRWPARRTTPPPELAGNHRLELRPAVIWRAGAPSSPGAVPRLQRRRRRGRLHAAERGCACDDAGPAVAGA